MFRKTSSVIAAILLALSSYVPVSAQFAQVDMIRQLRETQAIMRQYAQTHDHFPSSTSELDEVLSNLANNVSPTKPESTATIQSTGPYRSFGNFVASVDYSNVPMVNGIPQVQGYINAPVNKVVVGSNGSDQCWGWISNVDGKPLTLDNGPAYFVETIKNKGSN
jgi:hypothetical protein